MMGPLVTALLLIAFLALEAQSQSRNGGTPNQSGLIQTNEPGSSVASVQNKERPGDPIGPSGPEKVESQRSADQETGGEYWGSSQSNQTTPQQDQVGRYMRPQDPCTSSGFFAVINQCHKFIRCVEIGNGYYSKYPFDCAPGTVWDPNVTTCNHPYAVSRNDCGEPGGRQYSQNPQQLPPQQNQTSPGVSEQQQLNQSIPQGMGGEILGPNDNCTNAGYFGVFGQCYKFVRCVGYGNEQFNKFTFDCPRGTMWDPAVMICNHAYVVQRNDCEGSEDTGQRGNQTSSSSRFGEANEFLRVSVAVALLFGL